MPKIQNDKNWVPPKQSTIWVLHVPMHYVSTVLSTVRVLLIKCVEVLLVTA